MDRLARIIGVWIVGCMFVGGGLVIANVPLDGQWTEQQVLLVRIGLGAIGLGVVGIAAELYVVLESWRRRAAIASPPGFVPDALQHPATRAEPVIPKGSALRPEWSAWQAARSSLLSDADRLINLLAVSVRDGKTQQYASRVSRFVDKAREFAASTPGGESLLDLFDSGAFQERTAMNLPNWLSANWRPELPDSTQGDQMSTDKVWQFRWLVEHVPPPDNEKPAGPSA
jgi:hypothetical protein